MKIKSLQDTPLAAIVDCLLDAFTGYYVQMPADLNYWKNRFETARVDLGLSFGMFDKGELVGFIIHGIDQHNASLTAFNTGTGVRSTYRSQKIVDQLYGFALPRLKERKIQKCMLEVICENERAINVYERIGFSKIRKLNCFKGNGKSSGEVPRLSATTFNKILKMDFEDEKFYTWDHNEQAMRAAGKNYEHYFVTGNDSEVEGYFSYNPTTGSIARLYTNTGYYGSLMNGIRNKCSKLSINNIDEVRRELIRNLSAVGFKNHISQFEMQLSL